jgi:hypothetical protein
MNAVMKCTLKAWLLIGSVGLESTLAQKYVQIQGNSKTHSHVILRELGATEPNPRVRDSVAFYEGIQQLRNTNLFAKVEGMYSYAPDTALVQLEEKWTTIPIIQSKGGGGLLTYTLGLYDPHILGKAIEAGAQYQNFNGAHGGVMWFRKPWFGGGPLLLGADVWLVRRLDTHYSQHTFTPELGSPKAKGDSLGVAGWERWRGHVFLEQKVTNQFIVHYGLDYLKDKQSANFLRPAQQAPAPFTSEDLSVLFAQFMIRYTTLNTFGFVQEGLFSEHMFEYAMQEDVLYRMHSDIRFFWLPHKAVNIAFKNWFSQTNSLSRSHQYLLGGLEHIRGVPNAWLVGSKAWLFNAEVRYTVLSLSFLGLQAVAFTDLASAQQSWGFDSVLQTSGGGIRVSLPKVYRLNIRIDYAMQVQGTHKGIAFGLQQFF